MSCRSVRLRVLLPVVLLAPVVWLPVPSFDRSSSSGVVAAAGPVEVPPLGVSGTPEGESARSEPLPGDVLMLPPSDGVPVRESWDARLARERAAAAKPVVVGFDVGLSVEDPSRRTSHGTTYRNVDGTWTTVIDDHAVHYLVAGGWETIDARVVPTRAGVWVTAANDHRVTFSSRSIELAVGKQRVRWSPVGVALGEPVVSADGLTVTYLGVWPGVDLRYRLETDMVTEEIVISDAKSVPADGVFAFEVIGPGIRAGGDGVPVFEGVFGEGVGFGGVEVFDAAGLPISTAAQVSLSVGGRSVRGADKVDRLSVGVDPLWVAGLPASAFPLVVDPTTVWGTPSLRNATSNAGGYCATNPLCDTARVGNLYTTVNRFWHTGVGFSYEAYLPSASVASQLTAASLYMAYVSGATAYHPIAVRHATSYGYCGTNYNNDCAQATTPYLPLQWMATGSVNYDVMSFVGPYWYAGASAVGFALSSSENLYQNSYKRISTQLTLTYNRLPIPQASEMSPANPYTFHSSASGISLSINQLTDPDGEALYYRFLLCSSGCTTIWDDSGWDSVGVPDSTPWTYTSALYPPGPGLTAAFYNQQLYWNVRVSNSPTGSGLVAYSPDNQWKLVNSCPATPAMSDPATGSGGFVWAPNNPPTLTITPYADPDGDSARYRFVIREKGATGSVYTSDWSTLSASLSPISFTVPADLSLQPGVSYEWSAEGQDYTTYFHWYYYNGEPCSAASSFRTAEFEARLGSGGPSPSQSFGPVAVNLATGNLTTAIATPQVTTLGGAMGASLSYNSRANDIGLRARLYNDANGNMLADAGELQTSRVDREMSFKWATPGAVPGITNLVGTWTGYLTVPAAGTYHIAAAVGADERVQVQVGTSYTLQANYVNPALIGFNLPQGSTPTAYNAQSNVSATAGGFVTTTAFQVLPITVTYRNPAGAGHLALYLSTGGNFGDLPTTWLSPDARVVPRGWVFNHLDGAGASYTSARVEATEIILTRADGSTVSYARNATGGYTPPANENDVVSFTNNKVTVIDTGGAVHQFNTEGQLETVTAPADTKTLAAAAPIPVWTSVTLPGSTVATSRMTALTDPISARQVVFKYETVGTGACPSAAGFVAVPAGMLCQISYPDGSTTKLFYVADGQGSVQLSRVENPGDATLGYPTLDLGYTQVSMPAPSGGSYTVPLLSSVRDPLVNDAIAAGVITASPDYLTSIAYDGAGRVLSVTAPKPSPSATFRQQVFIDYQMVGAVTFNETRTRILGLDDIASSTDWDRKVEFDSGARTTREYQALNATSTQFVLSEYQWDGNSSIDRLLWSKTANQITSYVYSPEGWVTDSYGPANLSCFNTVGQTKVVNGTCANRAVPHSSTVYDGGLSGLSVTVWPNYTFSGQPSNMATGLAGPASLSYDWGLVGPPEATDAAGGQLSTNFTMRLTGSIVFPATGTYTFSVVTSDTVWLYVDDQLVPSGGTFVVAAGSSPTRRMRVEHRQGGGTSSFTVNWAGPGISGTVSVPISALKPRYGLVTSSTVDDSGGAAPSSTSTISYSAAGLDPVYGLATTVTSGGLTTTTSYETGGYRRRLARTLPAGNQTTYEYYPNAATADNPCIVGDPAVNQGGLLRYTYDPVAQTGKQIIGEQVYDVLGRAVASRRGTRTAGVSTWESMWSCISYDARQRPTTVTVPNNAGTAIERTLTTNYAVGGDPRKTSVADPAGTITAESDLLGRGVSYSDVWGTVTASSYDAAGEPGRLGETTVSTFTAGGLVLAATHAWDYDRAGRLTAQFLDGATIAIPSYNTPGSTNEHTLAGVSYPSGAGNAGNGTSLAAIGRNTNGAVISTTWNQGATPFFTNTVTRSQSGRVTSDSINGGNVSLFEYDTAGRLKKATRPGHVLEYGYGTQTGCGGSNLLANAGANSNRTTLVDNTVTIASYCYDTADRLVSTTAAGYGAIIGYDDHGNTTTLAGETLAYDGADRHVATTGDGVTVTYTRDASDRIVARTIPAPDATPVFRDGGLPANNLLGATSLDLLRPVAAVAGDLLLATVATTGATVSAPPGWTAVATTANTGVTSTLFWRLATGSDPLSWTFTLSASEKAAGQIVAYSGVHVTFPIDVTASAATASGTAHAAPQVTTTESNRLLLTVAATATDTTWTPAVGTTERVDSAAVTGAPTVTVHLGEHEQVNEGLSTAQTPMSASAAVGATMTIALRPANSTTATKTLRYSYSGGADATALIMTSTNVVLDRTISLPGGAVCSGLTTSTATWAYPNIHGDTTYTINPTGAPNGPYLYDPYGQPLTGVSNTSPGDLDNGWLGQHQRPTEHQVELKPTIEMGARPYRSELGRFLRIDPIDGGATYSNYSYVNDPVNQYDLSGERCSGREGSRGGCGVDFSGTGKLTRDRSVKGLSNEISGTFDFVASIAKRIDVSVTVCLAKCYGIGTQGGTVYTQTGSGCCFIGPNIGLATREYPDRACQYLVGTASVGPFGGSASMGNYDGESFDLPSADVEVAWSGGLGFGVAGLENHDVLGPRSCP